MILSSVNLISVFLTDGLGILLLGILLCNQFWKIQHNKEYKVMLMTLIIFSIFCCLADPFCFYFDGKPGWFPRFAVYSTNYFLFFANLVIGPLFVLMTSVHTTGKITNFQKYFLIATFAVGLTCLLMNFINPIVFTVNENNEYERRFFFFIYIGLEIIYLIDATIIFISAKINGGALKYFPFFEFTIPTIAGIIVQTLMYGVSTIWPCVAIGTCAFMSALQSELLFTDKLTNCYSRFYLDNLKTKIEKVKNTDFTAMMLDLNGFKSINDTYGHSVGDEALIEAATIFKEQVGKLGSVIRYAGDEFVILLNTQNEKVVEAVIDSIKKAFLVFNATSNKPYKLSASIGSCKLNLKEQTIDELLNEVDRLMYVDKNNYYKENDRRKDR